MPQIQPCLALGVFLSTAATDAVYVPWVGAYISMTLLLRPTAATAEGPGLVR